MAQSTAANSAKLGSRSTSGGSIVARRGRARWWPATSRLVYGHLAGMHIGLRSVERARQRPCDLIGSLRRAVNDPVRRVGEVSNVARFDLDVRIGRSAGQ